MPQDRLQRAFAIATGSGSTGDGFEVDPAGVKAAMKHLDKAYQKLDGQTLDLRISGSSAGQLSSPGEEDASTHYVRQAQRVGDEVYDAIDVMKTNIKQTFDAMKRALKDTERSEEQNADDLKRIQRGMQ